MDRVILLIKTYIFLATFPVLTTPPILAEDISFLAIFSRSHFDTYISYKLQFYEKII